MLTDGPSLFVCYSNESRCGSTMEVVQVLSTTLYTNGSMQQRSYFTQFALTVEPCEGRVMKQR